MKTKLIATQIQVIVFPVVNSSFFTPNKHQNIMRQVLILSSIFLMSFNIQTKASATINQSQEVAAENYCLVYGCGDLPPMDDL